MAATEGAETASFDADVGKVDVAIDHIRHHVTNRLRPKIICRRGHGQEIRPFGVKKLGGLVNGNFMVGQSAIQNATDSRR